MKKDPLAFVEKHGVVLQSARHAQIPSFAEFVAGEPIRGSWWSHRASKRIFALTRAVRDAPEVLVCRLADAKITFVHERLWPALVRLADRLPREQVSRLTERHSARGHHVLDAAPFPDWVPRAILAAARRLDEEEALRLLPVLAGEAPSR